jgi:hypothetical protein
VHTQFPEFESEVVGIVEHASGTGTPAIKGMRSQAAPAISKLNALAAGRFYTFSLH